MSSTDGPKSSQSGAHRPAQHRSRSLGLLAAVIAFVLVVIVVVWVVLYHVAH